MYGLYNTATRVRIEAVVTQLVFEHSLRMRLKAETSSESATTSTPPSRNSISKTASFNVGDETTDREDTSRVHDEDTLAEASHETIQERHNGEAQNLLGQITNFVTSDMINITQGTDFLNLSTL